MIPRLVARDIASLEQLAGHPVVGESWEGCVIETLGVRALAAELRAGS